MRLLLLTGEPLQPPNSGLRLRMLHLARALALRFDVDVGALDWHPAEGEEPFTVIPAGHQRGSLHAALTSPLRPHMAARLDSPAMRELAARGTWRTVQAEQPFLVPAALRAGVPVVLDAHNIEADVLRRVGREEPRRLHRLRWAWEATKTERFERAAVGAAAAVVATSDDDAAMLESLGARRVVVVPNGVDAAGLPAGPVEPGTMLLYVGHFGYRPNSLAAAELVDEILPLVRAEVPQASVQLVGRSPGRDLQARAGDAVEVFADVPDVVPHLRAARALVVPLRAGGGTRLKVLEALAAGVPVVSTAFGVSGLAVRDGEHVLLAETPADLARCAVRVIEDDDLARSLAGNGRRLVEERYDWQAVAEPLVALHEELGR